ncbi:bile acid:sodium symporter [Desulfococcaceae bacterium HSG8]|nr:bile acid:sodium symporter [Desulfococcaceae bacterium HSG8]
MYNIIKKFWFFAGLLAVSAIIVGDTTGIAADSGRWLRAHSGPDTVIFLIFLFSGLILDIRQIRMGLTDVAGILIAQFIIFIIAPLVGALLAMIPLDTGVKIGIFLVAVMPTTLSSGVVMTVAAGGNMAHALVITILSNGLSVFTIPLTLSLLLKLVGETADISIDKTAIMIKLGVLVIVPLCFGLLIKFYTGSVLNRFNSKLQMINQWLILGMVWMAMSQTRDALINSGGTMGVIVLLTAALHGLLLISAALSARFFRLGRGRRETLLFMGGQKTLTLSVILQVSLFPSYALALVVCVLHHIVHLMIDGYLVEKVKTEN